MDFYKQGKHDPNLGEKQLAVSHSVGDASRVNTRKMDTNGGSQFVTIWTKKALV